MRSAMYEHYVLTVSGTPPQGDAFVVVIVGLTASEVEFRLNDIEHLLCAVNAPHDVRVLLYDSHGMATNCVYTAGVYSVTVVARRLIYAPDAPTLSDIVRSVGAPGLQINVAVSDISSPPVNLGASWNHAKTVTFPHIKPGGRVFFKQPAPGKQITSGGSARQAVDLTAVPENCTLGLRNSDIFKRTVPVPSPVNYYSTFYQSIKLPPIPPAPPRQPSFYDWAVSYGRFIFEKYGGAVGL